jgi:hypothetical protein
MARQQVVLRAARHRLFRQCFVIVTSEDKDRNVRRGAVQFVERLDAATIGQDQFEQDRGDTFLAQAGEALAEFVNPLYAERTCCSCAERCANCVRSGQVIFDQKYLGYWDWRVHYASRQTSETHFNMLRSLLNAQNCT